MPVISKTAYPAAGEPGYQKVVKVDADGEFSIVLPVAVGRVLGFNVVKGGTKEVVERAFREAVADCDAACTSQRKVIGYAIDQDFGSSFREGVRVNLAAQVFIEETTAVGGSVRRNYEVVVGNDLPGELTYGTHDFSWSQHATFIEHTPEREAFFARVGNALLAVAQQIARMQDVTKAVAYADGQEPFLALPDHVCTPGENSTVCTICGT